jgi:hypothetical protein
MMARARLKAKIQLPINVGDPEMGKQLFARLSVVPRGIPHKKSPEGAPAYEETI